MDWRTSLDFDRQVEGCSAVVHLGVEKRDIDIMPRVNVDATRALAESADRAGIRLFCYASSVSVYGSPRTRFVNENSPVVTPERDVASEYWAEPFMRAYARSKVASERLLAQRENKFRCVILRPTVVRRREDILALGKWSFLRRLILAGRLTHTVSVEDVIHSIIWFLKDTLDRKDSPVQTEIYNVADDDPNDSYAAFFKTAFTITQDSRYGCPPHLPATVDRLMNWYKYRTLEPRWPFGLVIYSAEKLLSTGYKHVLGANGAYRNAFLEKLNG
jgi:nucleoside-diphosphate-sugar epimerase